MSEGVMAPGQVAAERVRGILARERAGRADMAITDGKAERELRGAIRELEREVRVRTGALYMETIVGGDFAGAAEKLAPILAAVKALAPAESLAVDAMRDSA
jgi:hypothetical protein